MYHKKRLPGPSKHQGFTLVEIIIVLAIIAILTAIMIPALTGWIDKAKEKKLDVNMSQIAELVYLYSFDYDKSDWHGSWSQNNKDTLNNFLEIEWELIENGTYKNNLGLVNPYSGKMSILDYFTTLGSGDGCRPAIFLTATEAYAYETGIGSTNNLIGTIVLFFKASGSTTEYIEIYYVKKDGKKSGHSIILD